MCTVGVQGSVVGLCMVVVEHVKEGCRKAGLQRLEALWGPGPKGEGSQDEQHGKKRME